MNAKEFFLEVYAPWVREHKGRTSDLSKSKKELGQIKNCINSLESELGKFHGLFNNSGELAKELWEFFVESPEFDWVTDKDIASFAGNVVRCVDRYREIANNENTKIYIRLKELERDHIKRELEELIPDRRSKKRIGAPVRR